MTENFTDRAGLQISPELLEFVEKEALPAAGLEPEAFWPGVAEIFADLAPRNKELLETRDRIQQQLDDYHRANPGQPDPEAYREFLTEIGYLLPRPEPFTITTANVDPELTHQAGPQLVVPVTNARFAINAANARWGSLYDVVYGSDVIDEEDGKEQGTSYNPVRGEAVIALGREFLDQAAALTTGSHKDSVGFTVEAGVLKVELKDGTVAELADPAAFIGYAGEASAPTNVLIKHNNLHVDILINPEGAIGKTDAAGIQDIILESAITSIIDLEDSVAAVDPEDKVLCYRNWSGLVNGYLEEEITKNGKTFTRVLADDREYTAANGSDTVTLNGRSVLLVRNVGHLMTTDAALDGEGQELPEGILDAIMTSLAAVPNLTGKTEGKGNSATGSMYIVKPKMHGPEEVAFAVETLERVEKLLNLPAKTLKIGIMDEERRTTVNLAAAIEKAADRVVFINTGFLDRTGDEIHTSMQAGAMVRKADMKKQSFLLAYENSNVDIGLDAGFQHTAQIGKGMWAMPDLMADMLEQKIGHVKSGATAAWVPNTTGATVHALHYHQVNAFEVQQEVAQRESQSVDDILIIPLAEDPEAITAEQRQTEVDENVQSILGYVVRWIDQGVGCSKVPDIHDVALMEDRATLRISSQVLANWLEHGLITIDQVDEALERLSEVVDRQNEGDPLYEKLIQNGEGGIAFQAARALITEGTQQPNGYTEPLLHKFRRAKKAEQKARG